MISLDQLMIFMAQYRKVLTPPLGADEPQEAASTSAPQATEIPLPFDAATNLAAAPLAAVGSAPMEASLSLVGLATPTMPAALPTREAMAALSDALGRLVADAEDLATSPPGSAPEGSSPARSGSAALIAHSKPALTPAAMATAGAVGADTDTGEEAAYPSHLSAEGRATPADGAPLRPADPMRAQAEPLATPSSRTAVGSPRDAASETGVDTKASPGERMREPEKTRLDSALSFLDLAMKTPQGSEKTGIVSSFMFNAAMTPGWPQRPLATPMDLMSAVPPTLTEEDALGYLAALGANEQLMGKLRKMQDRSVPGRKILFFIAVLVTALSVVIDQLRQEIEDLAERASEDAERGEPGSLNGRATSRHIILG